LEFEADSLVSGAALRTLSASGFNIATDGAGNIFLLTTTSLNVYSATASDGEAPIRTIVLSSQPATGALAVDSSGGAYLTDASGDIVFYPGTASGNTLPSRTISGTLTGLGFINGLAIDGLGELFVESYNLGVGPGPILVFAPDTNGNVAPARMIDIYPQSIATDAQGNLYTVDEVPGSQGLASGNEILVYSPGAIGNAIPVRTIYGALTRLADVTFWSVAVDSYGTIYVCGDSGKDSSELLAFGSGASENSSPAEVLTMPSVLELRFAAH
jgi:hypothetical protein